MKQGFALQFSQTLSLTPALQQAIKLLQLSHSELQDELHAQVADNPFLAWQSAPAHARISANGQLLTHAPALAAGMQAAPLPERHTGAAGQGSVEPTAHTDSYDSMAEFDSTSDSASDSAFDFASLNTASRARNDSRDSHDSTADSGDYLGWVPAQASSLREYLHTQARLVRSDAVTLGVLGLLVDALTPSGYFEDDITALAGVLADHCGVPNDAQLAQAIAQALLVLHQFDPPGVGAFDVQQCLLLQLQHATPAECVLDAKTTTHRAALRIVREGFDCLVQRDRAALKKRLKLDDTQLALALGLIRQLDPKPGLQFAPSATEYAVPEVLVLRIGGVWQARLNPAVVPPLRAESTHAKFIKTKHAAPNISALHAQLQSAKQLVRTVQQHFDTVFRVGQAIVAAQQDFFSFGAKKIKPMVLRDIAGTLGLHESTVSRVTTKKYLQTPHGVLEMKYFFSSGVASDAGDEVSSTAIKAHLLTLLEAMPQANTQGALTPSKPHKPLSDQALTDALAQQGHTVARRTVAKYREQLGYAPAHARKPL